MSDEEGITVEGTVEINVATYAELVDLGAVDFDPKWLQGGQLKSGGYCHVTVPRWMNEIFPGGERPWKEHGWIRKDWERYFAKARVDEEYLRASLSIKMLHGPEALLLFVRSTD